jgi:hypothetical protein
MDCGPAAHAIVREFRMSSPPLPTVLPSFGPHSRVGECRGLCVMATALTCSALLAVCAITRGSLWMDEFGTWLLTRSSSPFEWWTRIQGWPDSDSQIPLYHFYMYLWTALFGTDVIAMRMSNAVLIAVANVAIVWPFRLRPLLALSVIVASCLSAPIWYYTNEIRPYILLYAGTCLMIGATIEIAGSGAKPSSFAVTTLCAGAVMSCGATSIGIVFSGSIALFNLVHWTAVSRRPLWPLFRDHRVPLLIASACIVALILHDVRMFLLGKNPAVGENSISTFLFVFYTGFGLLGIGPGMLDLRSNGSAAIIPFAPMIGLASVVLGTLAMEGLRTVKSEMRAGTLIVMVGFILVSFFSIFALAVLAHWRVLPRHYMPLVPLINILYAYGLSRWWSRRFPWRIAAVVAVLLMTYSSLSVRFEPRHAKDDYQHAAVLAASEIAKGGRVWWVADPRGALYYHLSFENPDLVGPYSSFPPNAAPSLVLVSKPDTYDKNNVVSAFLAANTYHLVETFPAFSAWHR